MTGLGLGWSPGETLLVIMAVGVMAMGVLGVDRILFRSKKSAPPREQPLRRHRVSYVVEEMHEEPASGKSAPVRKSASNVPEPEPKPAPVEDTVSAPEILPPEDRT